MMSKLRELLRGRSAKARPDQEGRVTRAQQLQQEGASLQAAACHAILDDAPDAREALSGAAAVALQTGEHQRAVALYDALLAQHDGHAEGHYKRANALHALGRSHDALVGYDRAITLDPGYANAFCNRGAVLERLNRLEDALKSYQRALELNPDDFLASYNRASVLRGLGCLDEALASYDRAISLKDDFAEAYVNRGNLLREMGRLDAAYDSFGAAIDALPTMAEAHHGRGMSLFHWRRLPEALAQFERAIALRPGYGEAYVSRGNALLSAGQYPAALASFERAVELDPGSAAALQGQGFSLLRLGRADAAVASYRRGLTLNARQPYLLGMLCDAQMQTCQWDGLDENVSQLMAAVEDGAPVSMPMPILAVADSPALHRRVAEIWVGRECPANPVLGLVPRRSRRDRIRVGYFSADFRHHAVSVLAAELFEIHDRTRFDVIAFDFSPAAVDPVRPRLVKAFDQFIDVRAKSDLDVTRLAREIEIDIAVDLGGFTEHNRTAIFAARAAPIQINYLGYPGTLAAPYMDYMIADAVVLPRAVAQSYAEKKIYLPGCYLPNDSTRAIADREFTREELKLPRGAFVFCCFNNNYKITPAVFSVWMRILNTVPNSVLWLSPTNGPAAINLHKQARAHGVDATRLIFADRIPSSPEHLARQRAADLFLDTLPYNAHATAVDALWAGLPVITQAGEAFAGRVAASLLNAIGLPELVTSSAAQYERLAVELAMDAGKLARIRRTLLLNRSRTLLFDHRQYAMNLQFAFERVYERHQLGLPPDDVDVLDVQRREEAGHVD